MPRAETLDLLIERAAPESIRVVSGDVRCCRIVQVVDDSRRVVPGSLFVARPGVGGDGLEHVDAAIAAGAVAVLAAPGALRSSDSDRAEADRSSLVWMESAEPLATGAALALELAGRPDRRLRVIGVTGTNGKTTIATLARQLVAAAVGRCGLVGTVEVHDGLRSIPARMTTPGRLELATLLGDLTEAGSVAVAMEISSHALHQRRTADLGVDVAIFTNLTGDHLDYHGTMAAYAAAKASLFAGLAADAVAIVNLDDPAAGTMLAECSAVRVGIRVRSDAAPVATADEGPRVDASATVRIREAGADATRLSIEIDRVHGSSDPLAVLSGLAGLAGELDLPLVGTHNAFNGIAAAIAAVLLGGEPAAVREAVARLEAPRGRLEPVHDVGDEIRVFVDYAHTDDAIRQVLAAVRPGVPAGAALVAVVGAGGDRDRSKRPRMLRAALDGADRVVVTSDNPRTEDPEAIIDEVMTGARTDERDRVAREADRSRAITLAIEHARPGDVIVIAGKGHEREQIVGTERRPFDDAEVARGALAHRRRRSA